MVVSGFAHAPVTKGLMLLTGIGSVAVALLQLQPYVHVQLVPHILQQHQWYRLAVQHIAFVNSSELFLALLIFYQAARQVERTLGSHKFASFLTIIVPLYTLVRFALLSALSFLTQGVGKSPPGPWAVVFAVVYLHTRLVPDLHTIQIGSKLVLGNHAISIHSLALLLAFSQPVETVPSALLAMFISAYVSHYSSYRIPPRIYRLLSMLFQPWIGTTKLPTRSWRAEPPQRRSLAARQARQALRASARPARGSIPIPSLATYIRRRNAQHQEAPPPPPPPPLLPLVQ